MSIREAAKDNSSLWPLNGTVRAEDIALLEADQADTVRTAFLAIGIGLLVFEMGFIIWLNEETD